MDDPYGAEAFSAFLKEGVTDEDAVADAVIAARAAGWNPSAIARAVRARDAKHTFADRTAVVKLINADKAGEPAPDVEPAAALAVEEEEDEPCHWHADRMTALRCRNCDRAVCAECSRHTPGGLKCKDCGTEQAGWASVINDYKPVVTGIFAALFSLATLLEFALYGISPSAAQLQEMGAAAAGADNELYRYLVANFLHVNPIHVLMNLVFVIALGPHLESRIGHGWMVFLIALSCAASSVVALAIDEGVSVGASGVGFAIMGAAAVLDMQRRTQMGQIAFSLLPVNLAITFFMPGISVGGHLGGLAAGAAVGGLCLLLERDRHALRWVGTTLGVIGGCVMAVTAVQWLASDTLASVAEERSFSDSLDESFDLTEAGRPTSASEMEETIEEDGEFDDGQVPKDVDCEQLEDDGSEWSCDIRFLGSRETLPYFVEVDEDGTWAAQVDSEELYEDAMAEYGAE